MVARLRDMKKERYPCPCCGSRTRLRESYGTWDICPACRWQDDRRQAERPDYSGGANALCLTEHRENYERGFCPWPRAGGPPAVGRNPQLDPALYESAPQLPPTG